LNILIAYDISVKTKRARKRYRKVLRICKDMGIHLQKSVFEFHCSKGKLRQLEKLFRSTVDLRTDLILLVVLKSPAFQKKWICKRNRSATCQRAIFLGV